jgi:hypothetical protein
MDRKDVLFTWYVDTNPKKNKDRAFFLAQVGGSSGFGE